MTSIVPLKRVAALGAVDTEIMTLGDSVEVTEEIHFLDRKGNDIGAANRTHTGKMDNRVVIWHGLLE